MKAILYDFYSNVAPPEHRPASDLMQRQLLHATLATAPQLMGPYLRSDPRTSKPEPRRHSQTRPSRLFPLFHSGSAAKRTGVPRS